MARSLYRFHLYAIYIIFLDGIALATGYLLYTLLRMIPVFQRTYSDHAPSQQEIVQAVFGVVVTWIIVGSLAVFYYWLIRRDMNSDPAAANNAVRSFFLNLTEGFSVLGSVAAIGFSIYALATNPEASITWPIAFGLPFLVMAGLLELERRRGRATSGGALFWQGFHFFGVQLILLFMFSWSWFGLKTFIVDGMGLRNLICVDNAYCPAATNTFLQGLSMLWFLAAWLVYALATRQDTGRLVRLLMHGLSLAYGLVYLVGGVSTAIRLLLAPAFHLSLDVKDILGYSAQYDFFTPLTLGLLCIGVYHWLYSDAAWRGLAERVEICLTEFSIAAVVLAYVFWWGLATILYYTFQQMSNLSHTENMTWLFAVALTITGLVYIPLDFYLGRRYAVDPRSATGPRRGLVLFLLGGSILAFAIGGAFALYAWGTAQLGSPISNWQMSMNGGLSAFLVGVVVLGIYLMVALREHLITRPAKQQKSLEPVQPVQSTQLDPVTQPASIEAVLDMLLAGRITREQAATLIHSLTHTPPV